MHNEKNQLYSMDNYEKINLDDYFQTGEGGTALTYNHKDGKTLAKLFMPGMGAEQAEREFKVNHVVYVKQLFYIGKIHNGAGAPPDAIIAMTKQLLG